MLFFCFPPSLQDDHNIDQDGLMIKRTRMGTCIIIYTYGTTHAWVWGYSFNKILLLLLVRFFIYNFLLGDLIDSVKSAAEGVKSHSTFVSTWMKNNVSPSLRNILPTSPGLPSGETQPSTSAAALTRRPVRLLFYELPLHTLSKRL